MPIATELLPPAARRHKVRPLSAWPEGDVLALIGDMIGPCFPVGSASRWHRRAGSVAEKRVAECVASVVHAAAGDDPLARRIAITAACHVAGLPAAALRDLIAAAIGCAILEIDCEVAEVAGRVATIRAARTRTALAELSARRKAALAAVRQAERDIIDFEKSRRCAFTELDASHPAIADAERWAKRRALPGLKRRLASARAGLPSYRLTDGQRRRLREFDDRLRRLKAARRALRQALRNFSRAKRRRPILTESGIGAAA